MAVRTRKPDHGIDTPSGFRPSRSLGTRAADDRGRDSPSVLHLSLPRVQAASRPTSDGTWRHRMGSRGHGPPGGSAHWPPKRVSAPSGRPVPRWIRSLQQAPEHEPFDLGEDLHSRRAFAACDPDLAQQRRARGHDRGLLVCDQPVAPRELAESTRPGTAYSSRPIATAADAVRSAPSDRLPPRPRRPSARPAMIRLRRAKSGRPRGTPTGTSLTRAPPARRMSRARGAVPRRVDAIDRRGEDRNAPPARRDGSTVCRPVDSQRRAGDHHDAGSRELLGDLRPHREVRARRSPASRRWRPRAPRRPPGSRRRTA